MENEIAVQTGAVDAKAMTAVEQARDMVITNNDGLALADAFCVSLKKLEKEIIDTFADAKAKAFAAHRAVTAAETKHLMPVQEARKIIKQKIDAFVSEQERLRQAEERRLQEEARKAAEQAALDAAEAAEKSGDKAQAEAILSAPIEAAPVVLAKATPKLSTVIRKMWTFRVVNPNLVPRAYLMIDESKLVQQARATQDTIKVPGVEFYQKAV
jgi:hypothetical protein